MPPPGSISIAYYAVQYAIELLPGGGIYKGSAQATAMAAQHLKIVHNKLLQLFPLRLHEAFNEQFPNSNQAIAYGTHSKHMFFLIEKSGS